MTRINKLDGLRGLFCLFVVFFHFDPALLPAFIGENFIIRQSESFVDFFFVLSGYLISMNYESRLDSWSSLVNYLKNRFFRIYPLLLFSTTLFLLALLASNVFFPHLIHHSSNGDVLFFQALDTLLLTNSTPILGTGLGLNFPTWSISSEMISYFLFGLLMRMIPAKQKMGAILMLIVICFMFLLFQERYFLTGSWGFVRGLLCFNLGYFVFLFSRKNLVLPNVLELLLGLFLIILFYLLHQNNFTVKRELLALVFVPPSFALFILVILKTNGLISRVLSTQVFQFIGKISYSIYLNHALIVVVIPRILFELFFIERTNAYLILSLILVLIILIVYSNFTYKFIELRAANWLRGHFVKSESIKS